MSQITVSDSRTGYITGLIKARQDQRVKWYVDVPNMDDVRKTIVALDNNVPVAGAVVTNAYEIAGLYSTAPGKGLGAEVVHRAKECGGNWLSCIATGTLVDYYKRFGFETIAQLDWNDAYAPNGWDYQSLGRPGIAFMAIVQNGQLSPGTVYLSSDRYDDAVLLARVATIDI